MSGARENKSTMLTSLAKFMTFATLVFILAGSAFAFWFDKQYSRDLRATLAHKPPIVTILADDGRVLASRGIRHADIALKDLPVDLVNAVLATEDRRFYSHWGLDPQGLARALWNNLSHGHLRQGGSTITQQLVKNVFLNRKRTMTRKFRELIISFWLEWHYSKDQILEYYFNRVYFGTGASYGIEAAAKQYFDKSASDLDLAQSALLAGLLKAPSTYSPIRNIYLSHERALTVLDNMIATGAISHQQAQSARDYPARLNRPRPKVREIVGTEYALNWIMDRLHRLVGRVETDLTIKTTLNYKWQLEVQKLVATTIQSNRVEKNIDQAAAVVMDETGGVKLMVGGTSYRHSQFNRVTMALRQPGSSFKPIVYLAAMESGRSPLSTAWDERIKIDSWRPRNYARFHRGPVTLRKALASSINTVAAKLAQEVGLKTVIATAKRLGIRSRLKARPSLALGSSEVTPLEMTGAYVPMMNGGFEALPHIIAEIVTKRGEVLHDAKARKPRRVIEREYVYDMNDMLGAVVREGTGKRAQLDGHPTAGKTGTTQNYRDAWFIGYTGHFVGGIWAGNDDNSPTNKVSGGKLPAVMWKQIMEITHKGRTPRRLPGLGSDGGAVTAAIIVPEQLPLDEIIVSGGEIEQPVLIDPAINSPINSAIDPDDSDSDQ